MGDLEQNSSEQTAPSSRSWLKIWLGLGGAIAIAGGTLGWLSWRELQNRLPAIISEELSGALGRPIKLGELQRFSLTGLRFGETILPPTAEDFTWARVQSTDISLNPLDLIFRRTFRPSLVLIRPEVSIKQRFDRTWVLNAPDSVDAEGSIRTEIGTIRIRNAEIAVGPVSRQQIIKAPPGFSSAQLILLQNVNLSVRFFGEKNQLVSLNLGGRLKSGTFRVRGEGDLETGNTNLAILGKKLRIDTINPFLGGNLFLGEGYAYTNLYTEFRPDQSPSVTVEGAARLQNGQAVIAGLPSSFEEIYGRVQLSGQRAAFDDTDLRFGPIGAQVQGSVSLRDGFQVGLSVPDVSIEQIESAFAQALPIAASGRFAFNTEVRGPLRRPRIQGNLTNLSAISVDRLVVDEIRADFSGDENALLLDEFRILPATGGSITAQGRVDFADSLLETRGLPPTAVDLDADVDLPIAPVANIYGLELPVSLGRLTADAQITGPLFAPVGDADWQLTEGIAVGAGRIDYADSIATVTSTRLTIANAGTATASGQANLSTGRLNLNADAQIPLDEIAQNAAIALPTGLVLGTLNAQANASGPLLNPIASARWQLRNGTIPGQGTLAYADESVRLQDTTFDIGGGILSAAGQADLPTGLWDIGLVGNGLNLGVLSPLLMGSADLGIRASGDLRNLSPAGVRAQGDLQFAEIPLAIAGANTLIDGPLALNFDWDGSILGIPTLTAPGLTVSGQVATIPDPNTGFPLPGDLNFAVSLTDYDLARINTLSPAANYGVLVQGRLDFDGQLNGNLQDPAIQGNVALRNTAVGSLALLSDVKGPIAASLRQGASLDLLGEMTTLQANIGADRLPSSLLFRNGPVLAEAQRQGDWLRGKVRDFPIGSLGIRPIADPDLGIIGGVLRSDFEVQMSTLFTNPTARASFVVNRPALGLYAANTLQGQLQVTKGRAALNNTFLEFPRSRFDIAATANLRSPLAAEATLSTREAEIQDILTALNIFDLENFRDFFNPPPFGTAADLQTQPILTDSQNLPEQIRRAEAARDLQAQQAAEAARALLPPLADLEGTFSADLAIAASTIDGVSGSFDVRGQDWVWGRYAFENRFVAQGSLQDQVLLLAPIRLESGDAFANLEGRLALDGFTTQLEIGNFDLVPIATWLALPLPLQGEVNASASLTGSPGNPMLLGTITVDEAALNEYPLEIGSDFSYRDAWFRFNAQVKGEPDEPLLVRGQVPYALPFMAMQPDSDELLVQASLGSGGFALIDMFEPYVAWGEGDASLLIEAKGPLSRPEVVGLVQFDGASITSEFLGESLTNLDGVIGFEGDRLQAGGLRGSLLGGEFFLLGQLPFLETTAQSDPADQPLMLNLDALAFNFRDEIRAGIDGEMFVKNSVQSPLVGGNIDLSGIRIAPGNNTFGLVDSLLSGQSVEVAVAEIEDRLERLRPRRRVPTGAFDDLTVTLIDEAEISVYPLVGIEATGQVSVSGPFAQPVGEGYIELIDGWVNTITTSLFLVTAGRRNLITLDPNQGLDPYIDIHFSGSLPLQRQIDLRSPNDFGLGNISEIPEFDPLASVSLFDEILIEAILEGHVSDGFDLLELSSTPAYPQERLLSMLSGGYLADLPAGEPLFTTGANLLFAFFTEEQETIGDALGLRRFRVGATTTLPTADSGDLFGVGVGVTAGITDSLSVSILQVLNRNQPYQLNVRYRLNNNLITGSSTDFSEESRVFLQYQFDF